MDLTFADRRDLIWRKKATLTKVSEIYPSLFSNDKVRIFVENTSVIKAVVLTFVTKLQMTSNFFYLSSIHWKRDDK